MDGEKEKENFIQLFEETDSLKLSDEGFGAEILRSCHK